VFFRGFVGDTARTVAVGGCGVAAQRLMDVTERALYEGISAAVAGNRVTDISRAIQTYVEGNGFSVVREFVGHGVGRSMHEEPQVPNFVDPKSNQKLRPGMTLAIEPMVNAGQPGVKILKDGWTVVTQDGLLSAHFEHTVLITETEPEILTCPEALANGTYRVELPNGHRLTAFVPGRAKRSFAGLKAGDKVTLRLTPYDLSVGRIVAEKG